jgi:hypothetical protein
MDSLFQETLSALEIAFRALEKQVPAPRQVPFKDSFVFRYVEQTAQQALIQKLARLVSGLHAARLLLDQGFVQEEAVLARTLDDLQEDILFLTLGLTVEKLSDLHQRYLSAFYEEEFDKPEAISSTQKRPMIPRKKIRAYLAQIQGVTDNPSLAIEVSRTLDKAFSGFVHGASPQIMDMYGGIPPKFRISGMLGTRRIEEHRADLLNYFYRGIMSFILVAIAFRDENLVASLLQFKNYFEAEAGASRLV